MNRLKCNLDKGSNEVKELVMQRILLLMVGNSYVAGFGGAAGHKTEYLFLLQRQEARVGTFASVDMS